MVSGAGGLQSRGHLPRGKNTGAYAFRGHSGWGQVTAEGSGEEEGSSVVFSSLQNLHVSLEDQFSHRVMTLDSISWLDPLDCGRDSHLVLPEAFTRLLSNDWFC